MIVTNREMERKRIRKKGMMLNALFMLSLLCGCTQSEVMKGGKEGKTEEVSSCFHLNVLATTVASTRSMVFTPCGTAESDSITGPVGGSVTRSVIDPGEASDKTILDLWVGQYGSNGDLVMEEYFSSMASQESVNLPLKRIAGTSHVWVVANAGNLSGKAETESVLKTLSVDNAFSDDGLPANNLCVMTGMWSGKTTENIVADIQLKRSLAKIKFIYSVGGEKFSFTPSSLELCNVPIRMKYIGDENPVQLTGDEKFKTYTVISPGNSGTHYWYVPENPAGTGTNTGGGAVNKTGEGVTHATCVRLTGEAVQDGVTYGNVVFTLYPGKDNNDYSIVRNGLYTINVTLTGIDFSDKRVTVGTIPEMQDPDNLGAEKGATGMFQVTTRPGMPWSFTIPGWLSAVIGDKTYKSGDKLDFIGPYKVEFSTTTANPRAEVRETSFTVGEKEIKVRQNPSSLQIVGPQLVTLTAQSGSIGSGTFKATAGLPWSATLATEWGDWLGWKEDAPAPGTEALGTEETLSIKALSGNPSASSRTGTLLIKGGDAISNADCLDLIKSISVTQEGATVTPSPKLYKISAEKADNLSVNFTATSGLPWGASIMAEEDWLTLTSTEGTTTGTSQSIGYKVPLNLLSSARSGKISIRVGNKAVDVHPGPVADITVEQAGSVFTVSTPTEIPKDGGTTSVTVTATEGLPWTMTPTSETNGITPPVGNSFTGGQTLTFSAAKNEGVARSAQFTLAVTGEGVNRAEKVTITQAAQFGTVTINQSVADAYRVWIIQANSIKGDQYSLTTHPPFNYDGGKYAENSGSDRPGTSSSACTITAAYTIEVENTQNPEKLMYHTGAMSNYCTNLGEGWRIPTMIELFAMWQKCKGQNTDATDDEDASNGFGAKFIRNFYVSSTVYGIGAWFSKRAGMVMNDGTFSYIIGSNPTPFFVRCVRDKTN